MKRAWKWKLPCIHCFVFILGLSPGFPSTLTILNTKALWAKTIRIPASSAESMPAASDKGAHQDHKPKHGGIFFMALDNQHHLEGVLLPPATFRIYLYDDHTKPLKAEQVKQANATVQIGESEDAPKIALASGKKQETMEANLGDGIKLPVTLTLVIHFPGLPPDARPELFTFPFSNFTDEHSGGTCVPMAKMPGMCP